MNYLLFFNKFAVSFLAFHTERYINNVYIDKNTSLPITIPADLMVELNKKARKKIRYNQQGKTLGLTNILKIYDELRKDINKDIN